MESKNDFEELEKELLNFFEDGNVDNFDEWKNSCSKKKKEKIELQIEENIPKINNNRNANLEMFPIDPLIKEKQVKIDFRNLIQKKREVRQKDNIAIKEIEVIFPFQPYETQTKYMETVLKVLSNKQNGLMESPTGTGKTLCLLSSSLAYLHQLRMKGDKNTKIMYFSRTHFQLKQVIKELKNTAYRPKMMVIGGRDYTCSNPVLDNLNKNIKKSKCLELVKNNRCVYYSNYVKGKPLKFDGIFDIEDLLKKSRKKKICGFHYVKRFESADIVFLPFHYAFNFVYIKKHKNLINDSILIFDEAHNIQDTSELGSSLKINLNDLKNLGDLLTEIMQENFVEDDKFKKTLMELITVFKLFEENLKINYSCVKKIEKGQKLFSIIETFTTMSNHSNKQLSSISFKNGIYFNNLKYLLVNLEKIKKLLKEIEKFYSSNYQTKLSSFERMEDFFILLEELWTDNQNSLKNTKDPEIEKFRLKTEIIEGIVTLDLWCMSSAYPFRNIMGMNPHSIILTSGTLTPMNIFSREIGIDFEYIFKGEHVIEKEQVFSSVLTNIRDSLLDLRYSNRDNRQMKVNIGNFLIEVSKITPEGMLVFFTSYPVMNDFIQIFKKEKIIQQIERNKKVFMEVKNGSDDKKNLEKYVKDHKKGAIYFAVCGAKLSEGMDFSDSMARCVIVVGIPYPSIKDERIKTKKEYLDGLMKESKKSEKNFFDSQKWYESKAFRSINQAIGRVIRHKCDYGAILFLDHRFHSNNVKENISKWASQNCQHFEDSFKLLDSLKSFFSNIETFIQNKLEKENEKHQRHLKENKKIKDYMLSLLENYESKNQDASSTIGIYEGIVNEEENSKNAFNIVTSFKSNLHKNKAKIEKGNILASSKQMTSLQISKTESEKEKINELSIFKAEEIQIFPKSEEVISNSLDEVKKVYSKKKLKCDKKSEDPKFSCKICFNDENIEFLTSPCGHLACKICWKNSLAIKKNCIFCKKTIKNLKALKRIYL